MIPTDEALVIAYKTGNQESLKIIINRYTPLLYNFVSRFVGRDAATDVVQDICIKIWKYLDSFDSTRASLKTWIFTIARNTATDFLRKKKALRFSDLDSMQDTDTPTAFADTIRDEALLPDAALQKLQDVEFLNTILDTLPEKYRTVLVLYYQENMTFDEIGKVLDKPLNTVKSQHRRAIESLRACI